MDSPRLRALGALAGSMPVANQQVATGLQQARLVGVQQQAAAAPASGLGTPAPSIRDAQSAGAATTAQAGQIQNQVAQQGQQAAAQVGEGVVKEEGAARTAQVSAQKSALDQASTKQQSVLAQMGRDAKNKLYDSRIQLQKDANGQAIFQESQLADWSIMKAQSQEQLKQNMQKSQQLHQMNLELMKSAYAKIDEQLQAEMAKTIQSRDQQQLYQLAQAKQAIDLKIKDAISKAQNEQQMWGAGGTVVGGVVGGVLTYESGGWGAVPGAALGGAVGSMAGNIADPGTKADITAAQYS